MSQRRFSHLKNHHGTCLPLGFLKDYLFIYLFIYLFLAESLLLRAVSLLAASEGHSSLRHAGFSLQWFLVLQSIGSRVWAQ